MSELADRIRTLLEPAHRWWPLTGVAVCVVTPDAELVCVDSGLADAASGARVGPRTRFEIGSISKSFTSFVLGTLADEGRVDLEAPIVEYLPWLAPRSRFDRITLTHLLSHTSGLICGSDAVPDATASILALRDTADGAPPGEFFHYSNIGYAMLGLVIERVTGSTVAAVVTDRLLAPLGMRESAAIITHGDRATMATGYEALHDERPLLPGDPLAAATWFEVEAADGNILATASDLGRYARMLLGRGRLDGTRIVSEACFGRVTDATDSPAVPDRYALGLDVEQAGGAHRLTHGGGMVGYSSFLAVDLRAGRGVVVLSNAPGESGVAERLARRVLAAATGEPEPAPEHDDLDTSRIPDAEDHVGGYGDGERRIEVAHRGGGRLELTAGGSTGRLYHLGGGRLGCDHPDWRAFPHRLDRDADGARWLTGPHALDRVDAPAPAPPAGGRAGEGGDRDDRGEPHDLRDRGDTGGHAPFVGHYRSWSPWYPSFRVIVRDGALLLIAGMGVEAPADELELVATGERTFRVGADPRIPERIVFGAPVDGVSHEVVRDGCRYSRTSRS